ncbi:MAG: vWA domain-containing protein, partial [Actinomycetota bacterium]
TRDFADYSPADLAEARRLMARLASAGATRRTARLVPASEVTRRPDLRRTARRALRTGGEAVRPAHRERSERPRRLVLLLDVSGSMEPYARAYVQFLQAAVAGRREVEAFAVGTRLTRITRELAGRDPDAAVVAAARRVVDWSGGTRLGDGIRRFNDEWGIRGVARGAVVVVVSDGWDRGDPERLGSELARLKRVAHRIIWVNPLRATPGFAPLAGGMAAALPHVDALVAGHSLEALESVVAEIGR